ncbi:MAG: pyridoxamine 5'-phosphate oxidase family protein [Actinobacteria bacterium]|nr:pyridoxamine 5'-phosphate oxidase family protein [Actinomycetota bacterium]
MSVPVDITALDAELARFGDVAFLITARAGARPHVVSVRVALAAGVLAMSAGRTSRANVGAGPEVALCWPGAPGAEYCLLVDGTAVADDAAETVTVTPTGAILHRLADASADLPSCVPLDAPE